jgi:hypothetical protein
MVSFGFGQSTRDVNAPEVPAPRYEASKKKKQNIFQRLFKKDAYDQEVADFRKRMKNVNKQRRKDEKLAQKPQYSNPLYFGHKKPPIKRPPGERKFCKECGLRH